MIARFDLAPVGDDEIEGLRMMTARQIMARLNVPMWRLPVIVSDMRKRKLAVAGETPLFDGVAALLAELQRLGIQTAIVSSDGEESVRRVLGPTASLISHFDCGAAIFGKHRKFRRVARHFGIAPARHHLHRRRDPRHRSRPRRRHGFRRRRLGLCVSGRAAGGGADVSVQLDGGDHATARVSNGHRARHSWPRKLRMSTTSFTVHEIGSIGNSSTLLMS